MPPRFVLTALFAFVLAPTLAAAEQFPYVGYVNHDGVALRSGPGKTYYATTTLYEGDTVEVYRHDPGGWYAVRPPQGSFSWVLADHVRLVDGQLGIVEGQEVVARVGTDHGDTRDVIQVRLDQGEEVVVLEAQQFGEGANAVTWFKIAPPAGEFRWIAGDAIAREPAVDEVPEAPSLDESPLDDEPEPAATRSTAPRRLQPTPARKLEVDDSDLAEEESTADVDYEEPLEAVEEADYADDEEAERPRPARNTTKRRPAKRPAVSDSEYEEDVAGDDSSYDESYTDEDEPVHRKEPARRRRPGKEVELEESGYEADEYEAYDDEPYDDQVRQAQYQTPSERSRARRDEAAAKQRAGRVASRTRIVDDYDTPATLPPRVRTPDGVRPGDLSGDHESTRLGPNAALEDIDLALSRMVTEEPRQWNLKPLKLRTEEILSQAPTAVERGRARLLLGRIERFEDVQHRAVALSSAQATIERRRGQVDQVREARRAGPVSTPINSSRYDGVGRLAQIDSNKPGGPSFALVDTAGRVRSYVTPAPGVNLRNYLGESVGITGTQGYLPDADRHHVTARRVTVLNGGRTLR